MTRVLSRHVDNPSVTKEYLSRLRRLSGVRRDRLYLGKWVSAEGQIYDNYRRTTHVITGTLSQNERTGRWWLTVPEWADDPDEGKIEFKYIVGAIDWGYRNPGCFQVWGIDKDKRAYRISEIYRREIKLDQWCEWVQEEHERYKMAAIFADSAEPRSIDLVNDFLGWPRGRKMPGLVVPADKKMRGAKGKDRAGLDLVRDMFEVKADGRSNIYLLSGAFPQGLEPALLDDHLPACLEDEIPGFIWKRTKDGQVTKEEPDPLCEDHALDGLRYMANGIHKRDLSSELPPEPKHAPDTWGDIQDKYMIEQN